MEADRGGSLYDRWLPAWTSQAACRNRPLSWFFHDARKNEEHERLIYQRARVVCLSCPVQRECLMWTMEIEAKDEARMKAEDGDNVAPMPSTHRLREGMFGGLTPRERVRAADNGWKLTDALLYSEAQLYGPQPNGKEDTA